MLTVWYELTINESKKSSARVSRTSSLWGPPWIQSCLHFSNQFTMYIQQQLHETCSCMYLFNITFCMHFILKSLSSWQSLERWFQKVLRPQERTISCHTCRGWWNTDLHVWHPSDPNTAYKKDTMNVLQSSSNVNIAYEYEHPPGRLKIQMRSNCQNVFYLIPLAHY